MEGPAPAAQVLRFGIFERDVESGELRRHSLAFNAYMNLAVAYRAAGQYDRAIAELGRALQIPSGHNRAHFQLGVTFTFMGPSMTRSIRDSKDR